MSYYDITHQRHQIISGKSLPDDADLYVLEQLTSVGWREFTTIKLVIKTGFPFGNAEMWGVEKAVQPILKDLVKQYKQDHDLWFWQSVPTSVVFRAEIDELDDLVARGHARKLKLK